MALDCQGITLTDDHTLESASDVMSQLQLDRRLPQGREAYQEMLKDLGFRSGAEQEEPNPELGEVHTQFVFQGQCLILGDSGVGKTSLVKSLIGKPFDAGEPKTKGIEECLVDRKWRKLDASAGLKFGQFTRFCENRLFSASLFGPGGFKHIFDMDSASTMDRFSSIFHLFLLISAIVSAVYSIVFVTNSFSFCILSFVLSFTTVMLRTFDSNDNSRVTLAFVFYIREFLIGVLAVLILTSNDCTQLEFSWHLLDPLPPVMWIINSLTVALMLQFIVVSLFSVITKYMYTLPVGWQTVECTFPGQTKFTNLKSVLAFLGFYPLVLSILSGVIFSSAIQLLTNTSTLSYCWIVHAMTLFNLCFLIAECIFKIQVWINQVFIIIFLIIISDITKFFSCWSQRSNAIIFFVYFSLTIHKYWLVRNSFAGQNIEDQCSSFTFLFIKKAILNYQKLKMALNNMFSSLKLTILDFAGDKEYYVYHHIFLRSKAFYVIVFNMQYLVHDDYRNMHVQRIAFWLESVCGHVPPTTPIFLVGTHRGNASKTCMEMVNDHLRQNLWNLFCDELVINDQENLLYFPIENTQGHNDKGIEHLQQKIMSTAHAVKCKKTIGCEIPFSWIRIQDAIITLRENKQAKFCVTLDEFPVSFGDFVCSRWSTETLKYFHEKGLVIYVDKDPELHNWVLLKPEILVDIIIQLVTLPSEVEQQQGLRRDWLLLHNKGRLTDSLLKHILSKVQENEEAMTAFLVAYDMICPLSHSCKDRSQKTEEEQQQTTHFVPSFLPLSADSSTAVWNDAPEDKKFYVFFERFLPEPLFHRLLSRAHKLSAVEFRKGQPILFRDVGRFWMSCWQPYRLRLLKEENMIEVTFSCSSKDGMKPSDVLALVFAMVEGICKRDFPFVKCHYGPACPSDRCPGHQEDFTSISCGQQSGTRRHVFNVMPACKDDVMISLYCVNHNFEDQLREWLP